MSSRRLSATGEELERLIGEERRLSAEIDQAQARRTRVRQTLERVRMILAGQQNLPIEGCAPEVEAPRPAVSRKLRPKQLAAMRLAAAGGWAPQDRGVRITVSSLERAGLIQWSTKGEVVELTAAGRDLLAETEASK